MSAAALQPGSAAEAYAETLKGLWKENPVFVQVLGMCPALAVTNSAINAVAMGLSTLVVLVGSSFLISLLRRYIPSQVRISIYIVIIATYVTAIDYALKALFPAVHRELGAFIALIVVNCIILGRAEAYAAKNTVKLAVLDAVGMGFGFTIALLCLGIPREVLGSGTLFGVSLFGPGFEPWVVMVLPPGGFLLLGLWLFVFAWFKDRARRAAAGGA